MLKFRKSARALTTAVGLAWATTGAAQQLPSPAAPATVAKPQSTTATRPLATTSTSAQPQRTTTSSQRVTQVSAQTSGTAPGVISADHVFGAQEPQRITQTGHRRHCNQCQPNYCPPECEDEGYETCLFNEDAEAFSASTAFWDALGYESTLNFGGWTQFGWHDKSDGVFNTKPNDLQAQQVNLYLEKIADGSEGLDWGGRMDVMYGTDAPNTQSFGNLPGHFDYDPTSPAFWANRNAQYGWAIPQLYAELAYDKLSVKLGHFYTLLGYQVVPATGNFFYSIPYTFNFSEAFTHTGALATYKASDDVTLYGGWTLGWDTGFNQQNGGSSWLGGSSLKLTDEMTLIYISTAGNLGWIGNGYTHSIVLDYVINDKWEYVFQSDLVEVNSPAGSVNIFTGANQTNYDTIGVNQYLFYTLMTGVKAGGRMEWWKADGISFYEAAVGVNVTPLPNLRIRPEVRHNWCPNDALIGTPYANETIGAVDFIITF
jgi:hypothetical protein